METTVKKEMVKVSETVSDVISFSYSPNDKTLTFYRYNEKETNDKNNESEEDSETEYEKVLSIEEGFEKEEKKEKEGYIYKHISETKTEKIDTVTQNLMDEYEKSVENKDKFHLRVDHYLKTFYETEQKSEAFDLIETFTLYEKVVFVTFINERVYCVSDKITGEDTDYLNFVSQLLACDPDNSCMCKLLSIMNNNHFTVKSESYTAFARVLRERDPSFTPIPHWWKTREADFSRYLSSIKDQKHKENFIRSVFTKIEGNDLKGIVNRIRKNMNFYDFMLNMVIDILSNEKSSEEEEHLARLIFSAILDTCSCKIDYMSDCIEFQGIESEYARDIMKEEFKKSIQNEKN